MTKLKKKAEPVKIFPFNEHMQYSIVHSSYLNVWEGSVRSGKTLASTLAWLIFLAQSEGDVFIMSGNTVGSLAKNVIKGRYGILNLVPGSEFIESRSELRIPRGDSYLSCYCYGASDKGSDAKLVGLTAYGWYADEVNKQHPDFINEAFNRTVASPNRKHFWTMNPGNPYLELYSKYIDRYRFCDRFERIKVGGFNWYHCTLKDNPVLTPDMIQTITEQYVPGSFEYQRFIEGKRVVAEGLIYPSALMKDVFQEFERDDVSIEYCAVDYGATHPNVMGFGGPRVVEGKRDQRHWVMFHEVYDRSTDRTTTTIVDSFEQNCRMLGVEPDRILICVDPSAQGLYAEFRRRKYRVMDAANRVLEGISTCREGFRSGSLIINTSCVNLRRELSSYSWDPKAALIGVECPIKINDDASDMMRYFAETFAKRYITRHT